MFVLLTSGTQKVLNKCWLNKLWRNKCLRPDSFLFPILPSRLLISLCFQDVPILLQTPFTRVPFTRLPLLGGSSRHSSDWRAPPSFKIQLRSTSPFCPLFGFLTPSSRLHCGIRCWQLSSSKPIWPGGSSGRVGGGSPCSAQGQVQRS